ncbi:MAG: helix-turn-helix domain-containing protein [Actinomycetota bacterium]|nr:helix-turn-helix domain-containing protein [Actinomycetota bacterium]
MLTVYPLTSSVGRVPEDAPDPDADWDAYRRAVGARLREARLRANLTQEALAHRAGVSRELVQRTERADPHAPRLAALWRMARVVRLPAGRLLDEPEPDA